VLLIVRGGKVVLALGLAATSCAEPLSQEECETLLDRYVSLLVASDRPKTGEAELVRLKQQAREKASRDPAFGRCSREVSRNQFQCAMKAENADRLEQCLL
jgi:hypothetical protein